MATITANITLNTDITSYSVNESMVMKKLGSTVGLENATGIATKKFQATSAVAVIEQDEITDSKWVYDYEGAINLTVAPNTASDMTLEYGVFYE